MNDRETAQRTSIKSRRSLVVNGVFAEEFRISRIDHIQVSQMVAAEEMDYEDEKNWRVVLNFGDGTQMLLNGFKGDGGELILDEWFLKRAEK